MADQRVSRRTALAGGSGVLGVFGGIWLVESRTNTSGGRTLATLEDSEDWSDWESWGGTVSVDGRTARTGARSLRVEAETGEDRAGASFRFHAPEDLSRGFPVMGLKWDPTPPYEATGIGLRLRDRADRTAIFGQYPSRFFKREGRWQRVPLTYRSEVSDAGFDFGTVTRVDVYHYTGGEYPAAFWIDDLSFVRSGHERGVVMIQFDDRDRSVYERAFPIMQRYGVPGTFNVITDGIGTEESVTLDQLHTLDDAGWDVTAHPQFEESLPAMDVDGVRTAFERATRFLADQGFTPSVMAWPYNRWDVGTVNLAAEYFDLAFAGGSGLHLPPARIESPLVVPRTGHGQVGGHLAQVDRVAERGGMLCLLYHVVGPGDRTDVSRETFARIVEHVASAPVDVVTATDVLEAMRSG